jgi:PqqD family protein of HPr-rel-A system
LSQPVVTELNRLAISPTGFVFDPHTGATYSINEAGRTILESLRDSGDLADTVLALEDAFDADGADLRRDVLEYVSMLREHGLVPANFELA